MVHSQPTPLHVRRIFSDLLANDSDIHTTKYLIRVPRRSQVQSLGQQQALANALDQLSLSRLTDYGVVGCRRDCNVPDQLAGYCSTARFLLNLTRLFQRCPQPRVNLGGSFILHAR